MGDVFQSGNGNYLKCRVLFFVAVHFYVACLDIFSPPPPSSYRLTSRNDPVVQCSKAVVFCDCLRKAAESLVDTVLDTERKKNASNVTVEGQYLHTVPPLSFGVLVRVNDACAISFHLGNCGVG